MKEIFLAVYYLCLMSQPPAIVPEKVNSCQYLAGSLYKHYNLLEKDIIEYIKYEQKKKSMCILKPGFPVGEQLICSS